MQSVDSLPRTTFSGRRFTRTQLARVQETVERFRKLSRKELARTLCEHLSWTTPNGKYKIESCLTLLEALEGHGVVTLPAKPVRKAPERRIPTFEHDPPDPPIDDALSSVAPIRLEPVGSGEDRECWKAYLQTYHYLGYRQPVGSPSRLLRRLRAAATETRLSAVFGICRLGPGRAMSGSAGRTRIGKSCCSWC